MRLDRRGFLASAGGGAILGAAAYSVVSGETDSADQEPSVEAVSAPAETAPAGSPSIAAADVFLIGGQSNATGHGNSKASPRPPEGAAFEYVPHGGFEPLADPVGAAQSGSAWPAFADAYWRASGRHSVYVPASVGGTSVHPAANDNWWGQSGLLLYRALGRLRSAMVNLRLAEITPTFRGLLWHQGETDAAAIDDGSIEPAAYRSAFEAMLRRYRLEVGDQAAPLYLFQLGRPNDGDTAGFRAVREIQREVAASDRASWIVFDDAVSFPEAGRMLDTLHYTQAGLNEMGNNGGGAVADILGY